MLHLLDDFASWKYNAKSSTKLNIKYKLVVPDSLLTKLVIFPSLISHSEIS